MNRLDDPTLVAAEYADDARLRRRAGAYTGASTALDLRVSLVAAVVEARPTRVLEVGEDIDGNLEFAGHAEVEDYVPASISMSPFVANVPVEIDEPFVARRANSIFVAEKAA